ncbi:uncharacterized protein E5676_scaffold1775G00050 [Cucumis melo var. makuwa]|uniref:Retrotransposon gag domain-containing protein n=1 Tax=Cucumis melo var. makuwa TaxID=1194695 RepID=A0A5A7UI67_CUCMM|nr:uncharacterized protein E6C27_scaffold1121G00060 [Cucumis melo var. makuwa]TYK21291.1 uncharacterized protein E5676_scaffold1775G00050 [Cucumis melo var. makuwa]
MRPWASAGRPLHGHASASVHSSVGIRLRGVRAWLSRPKAEALEYKARPWACAPCVSGRQWVARSMPVRLRGACAWRAPQAHATAVGHARRVPRVKGIIVQERGGRLRHTASLSADSDFRTADLLIELSKCRTIMLRSYDCDKCSWSCRSVTDTRVVGKSRTIETNISVRRILNYERGDNSSGFAAHMEESVSELDSSQKTLLEMINGMSEDFRVTLNVVRNEIADVNARLNLTMRAVANQAPAGGAISVSNVKIPEPKPFCGARDAKALENYIFDLEQYFKATNTVTEEAKVTLATMHLSEEAKLWWRSRYLDIQEGRCTVDTWDALKRELRSQFFSENEEILARQKLHDLRHTGEIQEYVKQFAGLMLDIRDMSKKDKVFFFVEGLKPWARAKLYEQRVQDLTSAYAATEQLFDLTSDSQDVRRHQSSSPERNRNSRSSSPQTAGGEKCPGKDCRSHQSNTGNTWQRPNNQSPPKRRLSCFICGRPHMARECPNKVDFHAFQASLIADSDDKSNQDEDEAGLINGGERTRIWAIKYLSYLQKKSGERNVPTKGGLLYVNFWINQKQTKSTMIDSGATHNFITEAEARRLRLCWENDSGRMKAVNSIALPVVGLVKQTTIKLGGWKGRVDFVVVKMDDFDVVLGMEFLLKHQVIPMPSARCLVITGSFPTIVQAEIPQPNGFKMISAMQLDKSHAQEEPPSVEILLGALEKSGETVPKDTLCVLEKCHGAMPSSWPKPHRCEGEPTMG